MKQVLDGHCTLLSGWPVSGDVASSPAAGVGFTSGAVAVLDAHTLEDVCQPFRYARDCVTHIAFSHDSQYMATAVSHQITLALPVVPQNL